MSTTQTPPTAHHGSLGTTLLRTALLSLVVPVVVAVVSYPTVAAGVLVVVALGWVARRGLARARSAVRTLRGDAGRPRVPGVDADAP